MTTAKQSIVFYDITSALPGKAFSPNTLKARYALNYKGIPFETTWLHYAEIEPTTKRLGARATRTKPDGSPYYTCPFIYDPNTSTAVSGSSNIIQYLESTYPGTPELIPSGSEAFFRMFSETLYAKLAPLFQFTLPVTHGTLEEEDKDYFRRTREALLGKTLEEALPSGPDRVEKWAALKAAFDDIDRWIGDAQYFTGSKIAFADLDIAGFLLWCRRIWGTGSDEWKEVAGWHHGRWANLVKSLEAYEKLA